MPKRKLLKPKNNEHPFLKSNKKGIWFHGNVEFERINENVFEVTLRYRGKVIYSYGRLEVLEGMTYSLRGIQFRDEGILN